VLERHRRRHPSFNDDIQGTGAVALAGVLAACRLRGERLADQRIVIHGAGAGGVGVAWALLQGMLREGLGLDEARARLFLLDSRGLLTTHRALEPYKQPFAQDPTWLRKGDLLETVRGARATVLLGLSGQPGAFTEEIVRAMHGERPVIFPMSNPTSSSEADPADLRAWTGGRALVAAGSPYPQTAQANNAFVFPGLGLGAMLCEAREITDGMVLAGAYALAAYTKAHHPDRLYPPVGELREVSVRVATAVIEEANAAPMTTMTTMTDVEATVRERFWMPRYML
jgi:malate dehydrogenase (oxaloacetate-decarboxylating)